MFRTRKRLLFLTLLLPLILVLGLVWHFRLHYAVLYWFDMNGHADQWKGRSLWLPSYRVTIDAHPISGVTDNASGLTFSDSTKTLFSVINRPPQVIEMNTDGEVLRLIPVHGVRDLEGITHVEGDEFIITDERAQKLFFITVSPGIQTIDVTGAPSMKLEMGRRSNLGLEGVSWDSVGQRIFMAKEKSPMHIYTVAGLEQWRSGTAFNLDITEWRPAKKTAMFMRDISSLSFHEATGHLLVLSDESKLLVEYAADGTLVSMMSFWRGCHGLKHSVPQAEGIAVDDIGNIYIVSEPNLFYRFEPVKSVTAAKQ